MDCNSVGTFWIVKTVDMFPRTNGNWLKDWRNLKYADINQGQSSHVETVVLLSHKKPDSHINVKVEFGEGEDKVPLKAISERAEAYKPKERVTGVHRSEIWLQSTYRIYCRGKEEIRFADVRCSKCGRGIETAEEASNTRKSRSNQRCLEAF